MKTHFKIRSYADSNRPLLKFVVNFKDDGKRARRFFGTKKEAETFAQQKAVEAINQGTEGAEFSTELRVLAKRAEALLAPYGKTIVDAAEFFAAHLRRVTGSRSFSDVAAEVLATRKADGASADYLRDIRLKFGAFGRTFGERMVADITAKEVHDWLRGLTVGAVSRNTTRSRLGTLFSFARRQGYTERNPIEDVERAKERSGEIGILTVAQTARILETASAETLPYWAIGAFAGLRSAELERLDWAEVDLESGLIEVKAAKAKTGSRRLIPISDNLREWLMPHAKNSGPVLPIGARKKLEADRDRAGMRQNWPQNALRHSFALHRLPVIGDTARLALEMGNSPSIVFRHYRELVRPKEAAAYWKVAPARDGKVVSIKAAA